MRRVSKREASPAARSRFKGRLVLIPWHIGDLRDITIRALQEVQRLRVLICEDPEATRQQLATAYDVDCSDKQFWPIGHEADPMLLEKCRELLKKEDVGVVSSSGAPCFVDPGAWLVAAARTAGIGINAPSGPSALTTMLSLSGIDWSRDDAPVFTFYFFTEARKRDFEALIANRRSEAVLVFLAREAMLACLRAAAAHDAHRTVTVFFDLSKQQQTSTRSGERVESASVADWIDRARGGAWKSVSDISLLFHALR